MRLSPLILALLLASAAAAQTPPKPEPDKYVDRLSQLPPDTRLSLTVDGVWRTVTPPELKELIRQGRDIRPGQQSCHADYSKIQAEEKASDKHLREMKQRGEVITVLHQFEQEMYYEDRRAKAYEKACGKPTTTAPIVHEAQPDMRKKACEALGGCKPVKHW